MLGISGSYILRTVHGVEERIQLKIFRRIRGADHQAEQSGQLEASPEMVMGTSHDRSSHSGRGTSPGGTG